VAKCLVTEKPRVCVFKPQQLTGGLSTQVSWHGQDNRVNQCKRYYYQSRKQTSWRVDHRLLDNTGYDLKHHLDTAVDKTIKVAVAVRD